MKKAIFFSGLCLALTLRLPAQLLYQDFSGSDSLSDYIHTTQPGPGQFNHCSSTGAGTEVSVVRRNGNACLRLARLGANSGGFSRITDFSPVPGALMLSCLLRVSGNTAAVRSVATFRVGSGFVATNFTESNARTAARFSVNILSTPGAFELRDVTNSVNSPVLRDSARLLWVVNVSGTALSYTAPEGHIATITPGRADLWADSLLLFNDVAIQTPGQVLTDFKCNLTAGTVALEIDDLLIDLVPLRPDALAPLGTTAGSFTAQWTPVPGATGYLLDVARREDFSEFISSYRSFPIDGGSANSCMVSGLDGPGPYYYRVRARSVHGTAGIAGGPSDTVAVILAVLPVRFTGFRVEESEGGPLLHWGNATEGDTEIYTVERSQDGKRFTKIGQVQPADRSGPVAYSFADRNPLAGPAYYRIKAVEESGAVHYTWVLRRNTDPKQPELLLFPNPSRGGRTTFRADLPAGPYRLVVCTPAGVLVGQLPVLPHRGGMLQQEVSVERLGPGVYYLRLLGPVVRTAAWMIYK
ncbi:MAG TPA: fibronectin type III domain-containing protein [Chitinophagaceae bacterium]|nr:fibronectin type III domain-containing protein [Chitinophagaceae bacterium]